MSDSKLVAISVRNRVRLASLGKFGDSYDRVIGKLLDEVEASRRASVVQAQGIPKGMSIAEV